MSINVYFAAKDKNELAAELWKKIEGWTQYLENSGLKGRWIKSYSMYYGDHFKIGAMKGDSIQRGGQDGELALVKANHFRNLVKHILVMTTNQKPAFDCQAVNSDPDSLSQARLGNNILNYYIKEKRLGRYVNKAAEQSLVMSKGFVECVWEPTLGRPYATEQYEEDGETKTRYVYEGDIDLTAVDLFSCFTDLALEDYSKRDWEIVRTFKNRYDLAARYPEMAERILAVPSKTEADQKSVYMGINHLDDTALIPVYKFYHKKSDSMKNGRYMLFLADDCVLYDGPIPYSRIPVFRIVPGEIAGTTEGYTDAFDLVALQETLNVLISSVFTNQQAFAVQNVLVPESSGLSTEMLSQNLRFLKYNPQGGKPEALQLCATPAEVFTLINLVERYMETISGVNSVARGNPEASLKSGVALGLVQSMAIQFASGFQQSWAELLEDIGSHMIELLQSFAKTERMVAISGRMNRGQMKSFTGEGLNKIQRVTVDLGNPLSRTTAGRVEIADNLLQKGMIKTPQEYITVMETGQLDPLLRSTDAEISLIHRENEKLMDGMPVQALITDTHQLHVQEHLANLADPDVRDNPNLTQNTLSHVMEHINLAKSVDPFTAQMLGLPMPPPPPQMVPPPGGPIPPPEMMPPVPMNPNPPLPGQPNLEGMPTEPPMAQAQPM